MAVARITGVSAVVLPGPQSHLRQSRCHAMSHSQLVHKATWDSPDVTWCPIHNWSTKPPETVQVSRDVPFTTGPQSHLRQSSRCHAMPLLHMVYKPTWDSPAGVKLCSIYNWSTNPPDTVQQVWSDAPFTTGPQTHLIQSSRCEAIPHLQLVHKPTWDSLAGVKWCPLYNWSTNPPETA